MIESDYLFKLQGYQARLIHENDALQLQALAEKCADYCMLVDGHPARPAAAVELLSDLPVGKPIEDKVVLGIFSQENQMVGFLDAVRDYPSQGAWWIGLLLFEPDYRNKGLGRLTVRSFEDWAYLRGANQILLGVVEANEKAFKFWQSVGYQVIERQPPRKFDKLTHVVIKMAHDLSAVKSA